MPIHLESITKQNVQEQVQALLQNTLSMCDRGFRSGNGEYLILRGDMTDEIAGGKIGCVTFTLKNGGDGFEMIDVDLTLDGEETVDISFLERLEGSSDANEYYNAGLPSKNWRFQAETVCRCAVEGELEGKDRAAYVSLFPFRLSIYDSIDDFSSELTLKNSEPGMPGIKFSDTFIAPGGFLTSKGKSETFSFVVGTVESLREVRTGFGGPKIDFVLARIKTALGAVPAAMSREVFDLAGLAPGKVVVMYADVKADLSRPSDFIKQ